jgi:ubiquinone/menaquinone biosynthesis C-methylase UbiE
MDHRDHVDLLRPGLAGAGSGRRWADLGSGTGPFTLALADLLGPTGEIWSVDRDAAALAEQRDALARRFPAVSVNFLVADFARDLDVPPLDGIVMANSLHFERNPGAILSRLATVLVPGGQLIIVEYDADLGNRWVPYPISSNRWRTLAADAGLVNAREIGRRPSRFLGSIYSAAADRSLSLSDRPGSERTGSRTGP